MLYLCVYICKCSRKEPPACMSENSTAIVVGTEAIVAAVHTAIQSVLDGPSFSRFPDSKEAFPPPIRASKFF